MATNGNSLILDPDLRSPTSRFVASASSTPPPTKQLFENYVQGLDGRPATPELDKPRFNPLNAARPRSSALLNMNDPIAMHLLVETAILDSDEYEILSYEEVDDLKKEHLLLTNRIDAAKRKLALENKVREAALSLSRLYSTKSKGRQRRSLGQNQNADVVKQTDDELSTSSRRCEELSAEIWRLENRAVEIQKRLLQHCAGVLGMTHNDNRFQSGRPGTGTGSGSPVGSPVGSSYVVSRGRATSSGLRHDVIEEFDDRSLYRTPNQLDDITSPTGGRYFGGLGLYSSGRPAPENKRFSNERVVSPTSPRPARGRRSSSSGSATNYREQAIAFTERRVMDLNMNLRNFLVQIGSEIPTSPSLPRAVPIPSLGVGGQRSSSASQLATPIFGGSPGFALQEQLGLLEQSIKHVQTMAANALEGKTGPAAEAQRRLERTDTILESLWEVLLAGEEEHQHKKATRQRRRDRRAQASTNDLESLGDDSDDGNDEYEETEDEDEDVDNDSANAQFSISAFSGKFHNFYERSMRLHAERTALRRSLAELSETHTRNTKAMKKEYESRIEELSISLTNALNEVATVANQREGDSTALKKQVAAMMEDLRTKDEELRTSREDFNAVMIQLDNARKETKVLEQQLEKDAVGTSSREEFQRDLEELQSKLRTVEGELKNALDRLAEADARAAELSNGSKSMLAGKEEELEILRGQLRDVSQKLANNEKSIADQTASREATNNELESLRSLLADAEAAGSNLKEEFEVREKALREETEEKRTIAETAEAELRSLEGEVARLSTEVAVLKAELDATQSASRQKMEEVRRKAVAAAQAEAAKPQAAMDPSLLLEIENLSKQNEELVAEIAQLKTANAESGRASSTRGESETQEKALKDRCATLEKELNELLFDFESLTKQSIDFEAERSRFESLLDTLREKNETLESQLAEEKLKWLGTSNGNMSLRSPDMVPHGPMTPLTATPGGIGESTSTTVLRTEFKKMMKEMKSEQSKTLRGEQEARRKAENELRQLRKEHQQLQKQHLAIGLME